MSVSRLLDWDLAPANAGRLQKAGVKIALGSHGLKEPAALLPAVRRAVRRGLDPQAALRALTLTPAELWHVDQRLGSLEVGKLAHVIVDRRRPVCRKDEDRRNLGRWPPL